MTLITITLPLPPKECSPNSRAHYMKKARVVKQYRSRACVEAMYAVQCHQPKWKTATAQATFYWKTKARRDKDNALASLKAAFDGIADARVLDDDSGLTHLPVRFEYDKSNPRVEITIEQKARS